MALLLGKMKDSYDFIFYDSRTVLLLLIIISAERCPLLDIGLSKGAPHKPVLSYLHSTDSRDLHQIVGLSCFLTDFIKGGGYMFDYERTKDMFPSPLCLTSILLFYLYFSKVLGPSLMKDIKPFKLRSIMFYYNLFQIFICAYTLRLGFLGGVLSSYNIVCQPVDMTENPESRNMLNAMWWYTVVKLIDLIDTVFFVLRKKDRQISFLHVFHHSMMPIASYIGLKYFPNGHASFVGVINCIVHIVMYTYYLIAGLGPQYQKYLWWKKHLTTMQLVQFGLIFIHNFVALCDSSCGYPKWISALLCIHSLHFVYMFGNFYYVNYVKNPGKANTAANETAKVTKEKPKVQ